MLSKFGPYQGFSLLGIGGFKLLTMAGDVNTMTAHMVIQCLGDFHICAWKCRCCNGICGEFLVIDETLDPTLCYQD